MGSTYNICERVHWNFFESRKRSITDGRWACLSDRNKNGHTQRRRFTQRILYNVSYKGWATVFFQVCVLSFSHEKTRKHSGPTCIIVVTDSQGVKNKATIYFILTVTDADICFVFFQ